MNFRPAARAAGAALVLAPALLAAQTSTKVVTLGGTQYTMTAKTLVSAAGNIQTDSRYQTPVSPAYNGVGSVRITSDRGVFICTGSLMPDGKSVLTAAHCLTGAQPGGIGTVSAISVNFYPVNSTAVNLVASSWTANPNYSTEVIDENDIGVIHLAAEAPSNISRYEIYHGTAVNNAFEFVGYGNRGSNGAGVTLGAGFALGNRRSGENLFDITAGDSRWNCPGTAVGPGACTAGQNFWFDPAASTAHVLLTDFDNGTTGFNSNDAMCWIGQYANDVQLGTSECNRGYGLEEAISGGGDSGGPGFIDGQIASVTSFGLTFGQFGPGPFPDRDNSLNSSFGEFAGFTDVSYHYQWLQGQMDQSSLDPTVSGPTSVAPEPSTMVLMASGLFGVAGIARRRRNKKA